MLGQFHSDMERFRHVEKGGHPADPLISPPVQHSLTHEIEQKPNDTSRKVLSEARLNEKMIKSEKPMLPANMSPEDRLHVLQQELRN